MVTIILPVYMMDAETMEREQWAVRVRRAIGEETRQELLANGVLDRALKPRIDEETLLLPVTCETAERAFFESRAARAELPRHELVGGIAIMLEQDPEAARTLLRLRPSLHTVLFPQSVVEGEFRTRRFTVLAGKPTTATTCIEYGNRFEIDLSQAYFSARLSTERQRIRLSMGAGEHVLDMFAGIGPFAITLSSRAGFVVAVDMNPGAVLLMQKNIFLNHVRNVLPVLADASGIPGIMSWKFDRIVMNHPFGSLGFLPQAFRLCRKGGTIHCYLVEKEEGEALAEIERYPVQEVCERYVRSYAPGRWHAVYDITVR
jgi:tRNA (guanine37-N1)-methyltransferase